MPQDLYGEYMESEAFYRSFAPVGDFKPIYSTAGYCAMDSA